MKDYSGVPNGPQQDSEGMKRAHPPLNLTKTYGGFEAIQGGVR
jgi:hypothetical protein